MQISRLKSKNDQLVKEVTDLKNDKKVVENKHKTEIQNMTKERDELLK
jgi:cell division protein FtsB